jgi:hypothetical protein
VVELYLDGDGLREDSFRIALPSLGVRAEF